MRLKLAIASMLAGGMLMLCPALASPAHVKENNAKLALVQSIFVQIQQGKSDDERDKYAEPMEKALMDYATSMHASYDKTFKAATAPNATPKDMRNLKDYEAMAKAHEKAMKELDREAKKLKPPGARGERDMPHKVQFGLLSFKSFASLFISPAEAIIAYGVWVPCHTSPPQQPACATAIAASPGQIASAWSTFNSCWSSKSNVKPAWWRALQRAGCTAFLIARLA